MKSNKLPLCFIDTPVSDQPLILENPYLIDMAGGGFTRPECLLIENGRITHAGGKLTTGAQRIDASGKYVIPGLWDMHVHTLSSAGYSFGQFLAHGVTGIRDMGSDLTNMVEWREHAHPKPRISYSGPTLDGFIPTPVHRLFAETAQDVQIQITTVMRAGADQVKVHNMIPREAYFAAAERCRAEGLSLAGHIPFAVSAIEAVAAGQKSIEHMAGIPISVSADETRLRQALLQLPMGGPESLMLDLLACRTKDDAKFQRLAENIKAAGVYVTPTLVTDVSLINPFWDENDPLLDEYPPYVSKNVRKRNDLIASNPELKRIYAGGQEYLTAHFDMARALHQAGVLLLAGTDSAFSSGFQETYVFYGRGLLDELKLFVEIGLTPFEALKTATTHPANYLGIHDQLGSLEPGKLADMVILNGNPLEDIANIYETDAVIIGGKLLDQGALSAF